MNAEAGETLVLHAYNVEVAELLEETEAHTDPMVRSLLVIQATLALKTAHAASTVLDPVEAEPVEELAAGPAPVIDLSPPTVRAWATERGIVVSPTGRLPKRVRDLYIEDLLIAETAS